MGVYGILAIAAALCVLMLLLGRSVQVGPKRSASPVPQPIDAAIRLCLWILLAVEYFLAIGIGGLGLLPLFASRGTITFPWWIIFPLEGALILVVGWMVMRNWKKLPPAPQAPVSCWRWGIFYTNPEDPALWVPKRFGMGYTLNMAHREAWLIMGAIFAGIGAMMAFSIAIASS